MATDLDKEDIEIIELDDPNEVDPYVPERLVGVAILGAFGSLLAYYLYHQLDRDKRKELRETAVSLAKKQLARLGESDED